MEGFSRKSRICAITAALIQSPNKKYPLSYFAEMFGAAKSTLSEDVAIIREACAALELGEIDVVLGSAGGVRYIPRVSQEAMRLRMSEIADMLREPSRVLPGGFIYTADILMCPRYVDKMSQVMWNWFARSNPDFIITVETKGIPLAESVARLFDKPLVVARKESKMTEGSVVTINYLSGTSKRMQTMSLSKRAVQEGQRALIIDDFIAGGGSVRAIFEMMKEFAVTVVGCGVAIATAAPEKKKVDNYKSIFVLQEVDENGIDISLSYNV